MSVIKVHVFTYVYVLQGLGIWDQPNCIGNGAVMCLTASAEITLGVSAFVSQLQSLSHNAESHGSIAILPQEEVNSHQLSSSSSGH